MHFESLKTLHGEPVSADAWTNHVVLIVNVASKCGFTSQYKGLQALHLEKADEGLLVVGVPCNQFGQQEPGSAETIHEFCELNYGVTFPLLEKQDVNGPNRSALYAQLVASEAGGGRDIGWNFEKFLVGRDGTVLARFSSRFGPTHRKLKAAIDQALAD
jgi:glutathione peroxidase-family protein